MSGTRFLWGSVAAVLPGFCINASVFGVMFQVGVGKPYATIQAAVNAAAALDAGSSPNFSPPASPVDIVVYSGTYNENVSIPADATNAFDGLNDRWSIRNNPGEMVWVDGSITYGQDRDNFTLDGINIHQTTSSSGLSFNQTARSGMIKNLVIYGPNGNAAIGGSNFYGSNTAEHVTIYGFSYGVSVGYASSINLANSIIAFGQFLGHYSSDGSAISYSDLYGNSPNIAGGSGAYDAGGNLNYPNGMDPLFASTDPNDPHFLWLAANSPAAGAGSSAGSRTAGQFNMGALPTVPEPATVSLLLVGVTLLARRNRH